MAVTPTYAIPYVESSDLVANYPGVSESLAETLEDVLLLKSDVGSSLTTNPTFTNFTLGNGTARLRTVSAGRVTVGSLTVTLGSTSVVSGDIRFEVPTINNANYLGTAPIGYFGAFDTSAANNFTGILVRITGNFLALRPSRTDVSPYVINSLPTSSTVPFTWATGDTISATFYYENNL